MILGYGASSPKMISLELSLPSMLEAFCYLVDEVSISKLLFLPSISNSMQVLLLTCLLCLCVSDCPVHKVIMLSLKAGHFFNFMLQSLPIHNYTHYTAYSRCLYHVDISCSGLLPQERTQLCAQQAADSP